MRRLFIALFAVLIGQNLAAEPTLPLSEFSRNRLDDWEHNTTDHDIINKQSLRKNSKYEKYNSDPGYRFCYLWM